MLQINDDESTSPFHDNEIFKHKLRNHVGDTMKIMAKKEFIAK